MTTVARRIIAAPARPASEAWAVMADLLAPERDGDAWRELMSVTGIASSLIADEAFNESPAVVRGSGPRVRIYCLYGEEAISGDGANEAALAFNPTEGDWRMSLPCPPDDLEWVRAALAKKSTRITARGVGEDVSEEHSDVQKSERGFALDREAFFNS
jgi:hypothetical protein